MSEILTLFAGFNFTFLERVTIFMIVLIPIGVLIALLGLFLKKNKMTKVGVILLAIGLIDFFILLPNS